MAIKVDIEKASDRLKWNFVYDTLMDVGFPKQLICLIKECIFLAKMSLLRNKGQTNTFSPSRGIRQGDH